MLELGVVNAVGVPSRMLAAEGWSSESVVGAIQSCYSAFSDRYIPMTRRKFRGTAVF